MAEIDRAAALAVLREVGFEVCLGHYPDSELILLLVATTLDYHAKKEQQRTMNTPEV